MEDCSKEIKISDVTDAFKQSIGTTAPSGGSFWAKTYGGKSDDYASSIQKTLDSGYIVSGVTSSYGAGGDDIFVLKLNSNGNIPGSSCDPLKDIISTLIVNPVIPTVLNPTPTVTTPTLFESSPNLTLTSPDLSTSTICESQVFAPPSPPKTLQQQLLQLLLL